MTTPSRALGQGVASLIPAPADSLSAAARARAALAAVQTASIPIVVLDGVAALLEELEHSTEDEEIRDAARDATAYLRRAAS
ncbi:hypothetical protein ACQEVS_32880 [Streptomyces sp. CA-181903]|uniref:hypothetical protein n=1 Tax=Streptomyces sp. CA-181903 TaxID=3240055 RepID=UPI003D8E02C4